MNLLLLREQLLEGGRCADVITTAWFYCLLVAYTYCADRGAAEDLQWRKGSLGLGTLSPNCSSKPSFSSILPGVVCVLLMLMHAHP